MKWLLFIFCFLSAYSFFSQENEFYRFSFDYFIDKSKSFSQYNYFLKDKEEGWILFLPKKLNSNLIDQYTDWKITDTKDSVLYGDFSEKGVFYLTNDMEYNQLMQKWKHQFYAPLWEIRMSDLGYSKRYIFPAQREELNQNKIYDFVTEQAEFPGGQDLFYVYLSNSMEILINAENHIITKAVVTFVIAKDGTIHNVEIIKSPSEKVSKQIIAVIENMPNWIPARVKGKLVNSQYTLPLNVKMD